ncbi:MAG TPA: hypothetical protein VFF03_09275 [Rhodocyclaceae bacterium]|nr:hypothetical protein [Rhodocyclaceae bacterium]
MKHPSLPALLAIPLILSACGTPPGHSASEQVSAPTVLSSGRGGQLEWALASGTYHCELGVDIRVNRETQDKVTRRVQIGWNGSRYWLERDPSYSGLPRYEDAKNGLVWIDLPWKGLLLDSRSNKPLANECRAI